VFATAWTWTLRASTTPQSAAWRFFDGDGWVDNVGSATELDVEVRETATRHTVSVQQLRRWCDSIAPSPAETLRKAKLKQLIEG
jgi:hypothetical protein